MIHSLLRACLSVCLSPSQSVSLTDALSLCVLSCLSVRHTVLNNSLQPLRELPITFPVSVYVCVKRSCIS